MKLDMVLNVYNLSYMRGMSRNNPVQTSLGNNCKTQLEKQPREKKTLGHS
jgi:uncharacterized protein YlaI